MQLLRNTGADIAARLALLPREELTAGVSDEDLVARIRSGDRNAEAILFYRHAPQIARVVMRLLRSQQEAQDVLQDVFVAALEELGTLREPAAVGSWLLRVAVRKVHRRFRRKRLSKVLGLSPGEEDATLEALAKNARPEVRAELALVDRVLGSCPETERVAWVLRRVEGYALEEVAALCDCSLATVKRRVAAVDAKVKQHVGGEGPVDE